MYLVVVLVLQKVVFSGFETFEHTQWASLSLDLRLMSVPLRLAYTDTQFFIHV